MTGRLIFFKDALPDRICAVCKRRGPWLTYPIYDDFALNFAKGEAELENTQLSPMSEVLCLRCRDEKEAERTKERFW